MRTPLLALAALGAGASAATAGGLDELITPRSVGRAGVGTVSDDGAAAVITSPAALARRAGKRAQLGLVVLDDGLDHRPDSAGAPDARAQGEPVLAPIGAVITGVGPIVVGAAFAVERSGRSFAVPEPGLSADSVGTFFAYRYAGYSADLERRTAALAAAARVTDWLAVGVTATLATVRVAEHRRVWAGFTGRGDVPADATFDVDVAVTGTDDLVPGAAFGVFVAPTQVPLEVAASIAWSNQVHGTGLARLAPGDPGVIGVDADAATTRIDLPAPTAIRAGARWLGERWTAEAGLDAWIPRDDPAPVWQIDGARVIDQLTQRDAPLTGIASRFASRRHVAARVAVDLELVGGFLWLTGGYAYRSAGTPADRFAPTTAQLAAHTAALGIEAAAGGFTATLGWSRSFSRARTITTTQLGLDDPFDPGVTAPVGLGRYDAAEDQVGFTLELATE